MTATPPPAIPRDEIADLYRRHRRHLERTVARAVNAPRELIEDACQNAWLIMLRAGPRRSTWFAWLRVVATNEARKLCKSQRDAYLEEQDRSEGWDALIADRVTIDEAIEARRALELLAELPVRQRDDLALLVAGFSYAEICERTGGRTYTNVNKHLAKARARIRRAELEHAGPARREAPLH